MVCTRMIEALDALKALVDYGYELEVASWKVAQSMGVDQNELLSVFRDQP